jgi:hypothetical protein
MSKKVAHRSSLNPRSIRESKAKTETYESFDEIDGRHPWQQGVPDGFVGYPVRRIERGRVAYFNFNLAREMGLISASHPNELTPALTKKLLDTFCIQIVNEYDQSSGIKVPKDLLKPYPHMATRYLQLQHANKQGKTSGDGRSIWNGTFKRKGVNWDVSSRGTGVTCLSPGAVQAAKPLKTGATEFGYGCGLADLTELLGSALMSEIFHLNDVNTERVLLIIDLGRGCGIGVRAGKNLIRPAHLFLYLKQGKHETLKRATDYLIQRQIENGAWSFSAKSPDRFRKMLGEISKSFARFTANLERNYIFAWMDWDGDNILADAGIIDYGSIRQFGLRHDQYRYDDVDRFSTNLNEQRGKARQTVQVFAQAVDFLETGVRKSIEEFGSSTAVREFDREFDRELRRLFLRQIGLSDEQVAELLAKKSADVERLYSSFVTLEKTKTKAGMKKVPDGLNRPAVFNMRTLLRELPVRLNDQLKDRKELTLLPAEVLLKMMTSTYAKRADLRLGGGLKTKIDSFQKSYLQILKSFTMDATALRSFSERAFDKNRPHRITGNGAEFIVDAVVKARRRGLEQSEIQTAIELFIASQAPSGSRAARKARATSVNSPAGVLLQEFFKIMEEFEEDI